LSKLLVENKGAPRNKCSQIVCSDGSAANRLNQSRWRHFICQSWLK